MYLFPEQNRPHASYACPACRKVNVLEEEDLAGYSAVITVKCLACGRLQGIERSYMEKQLSRDLAAA